MGSSSLSLETHPRLARNTPKVVLDFGFCHNLILTSSVLACTAETRVYQIDGRVLLARGYGCQTRWLSRLAHEATTRPIWIVAKHHPFPCAESIEVSDGALALAVYRLHTSRNKYEVETK